MNFNQKSFSGGMNLLVDDTRLPVVAGYKLGNNPYSLGYNQYRLGINVRNRFDVLNTIQQSKKDTASPKGIKQELVTFGNYIILFVAGKAWYRYYTDTGWKQIVGFQMSAAAPRLWTKQVPVATTNYARQSIGSMIDSNTVATAQSGVNRLPVDDTIAEVSLNGLLVQDNINQPQFIFIDDSGIPTTRTTQTFAQWNIVFDSDGVTVTADNREYVPIGNAMEWTNGVLYIVSQDFNFINRSVSGRPLDFVINVNTDGSKGGDATTTNTSVGVGGISCIRATATGSLFVAASNSNFILALNQSNIAPLEFGEFTFTRQFLFNATLVNDRSIIDSLGDTRFIGITGIRSFNAVEQEQNEGRNSEFSAIVQAAFNGIVQDFQFSAAILYDNYELYACTTIFGNAIVVYDTILSCWTSFDLGQVPTRIKQLAKIELTIQRLYAIGEDDELYELYGGTEDATSYVRLGASSDEPKLAHKLTDIRLVINNITEDCTCSAIAFTDNRLSEQSTQTKKITYPEPTWPYTGIIDMPDIDTLCQPVLFSFPNAAQGWKTFALVSWNNGTLTEVSMGMTDSTPMNQLTAQANAK